MPLTVPTNAAEKMGVNESFSIRPDPDGVLIIPGQTANMRKQGIPSGFKPHDTISRGARQSGPVRATGKEKEYFHSRPSSKPAAEDAERSSKRRRVENSGHTQKRISISDDDTLDHSSIRGSPVATRTDAQSPTPSQLSSQGKQRRDYNSGPKSENQTDNQGTGISKPSPKQKTSFVDRFSSEDQDISFTRDAAKERRRESMRRNEDSDDASRKLPRQTSNLSAEIVKNPSILGHRAARSPSPRHFKEARASFGRESPDELQGGATVGPVPTSLGDSKRDPPRKTSFADIRPTDFISYEKPKRGTRKAKKQKSSKKCLPATRHFKIFYYRGGPWLLDALGGDNDKLVVDPAGSEVTIRIADSGIVRSISLQKVLRVLVGEPSSRKIRLELSKVEGEDTKLDLELSSPEETESLSSFLRELKVEVQEKKQDYIDNAFKKSEREHQRYAPSKNGYKRPLGLIEVTEEIPQPPQSPQPPPDSTKRMKLSDALQDKDGNSPETAAERRTSPALPATTHSDFSNHERPPSPSSGPQRNIGVEIPGKKNNPNLQTPTRATRSMLRQAPTTFVCDDDDDSYDQEHTPQPNRDVDQKWDRKPLVYPRFGKKKAEVNALDLERLAPHEFLNDNIIGFYLRFLEDHLQRCNAEVAKRVYFFNSYFYATLTNSPKGRRSINYEGVEKWTRNVDLFSYDYIVVPINEDAHWYIAIICNLPYLEGIMEENKIPTSRPSSEVQEIPETPGPSQQGEEPSVIPQTAKEEMARQSLASMNISEQQGSQMEGSNSGDEEWPECEEYPDPTRAKFSDSSGQPQLDTQKVTKAAGTPKKSCKPKRKPTFGMRYNICQPIVITFDSLNLSRSSTISTLREYLFAEAKSKRNVEINKALVKGMTAKEIPQQPNFSDCGLYLLAYVEKFIQDPDLFIRKLLRKEMRSREDWPPLRSGLLRSRLRKFMELLYSEQEQLTKVKADEDKLLVDQQPLSYLLGSPTTDVANEEAEGQKSPQVQVERSPPADAKSKEPVRNRDPSPQPNSPKPDLNTTSTETQESVVFVGRDPGPRTETHPQLDVQHQSPKRVVIEVPDSQDQAKAPTAEAAQITDTRSPEPPTKRADAVYHDGSDVVEEYAPQRKETGGRRVDVQVQVEDTPPGSPSAR
ncbi:hypothetical protein BDW62DRAFT_200868 [Aspergillus aurantiobrunneus]